MDRPPTMIVLKGLLSLYFDFVFVLDLHILYKCSLQKDADRYKCRLIIGSFYMSLCLTHAISTESKEERLLSFHTKYRQFIYKYVLMCKNVSLFTSSFYNLQMLNRKEVMILPNRFILIYIFTLLALYIKTVASTHEVPLTFYFFLNFSKAMLLLPSWESQSRINVWCTINAMCYLKYNMLSLFSMALIIFTQ